MGWWRDRQGRVLGDGPADTLGEALMQVGRTGPKPALAALLGAVAQALRTAPGHFAVALPGAWRLVARVDARPLAEGAACPEALRLAVTEALDGIADQYRSSEMARLPTVDEVVATLGFVLGHHPWRYLDGGNGNGKVELSIELPP